MERVRETVAAVEELELKALRLRESWLGEEERLETLRRELALANNDRRAVERRSALRREQQQQHHLRSSHTEQQRPPPAQRRRVLQEETAAAPTTATTEETKARNRRLFGTLLLGTLKSFRSEEATRGAADAQRQALAAEAAAEAEARRRADIDAETTRLHDEAAKAAAAAASAGRECQRLEACAAETRWELQRVLVGRFRRTRTRPSVCFASRDLLARLREEPPEPVAVVQEPRTYVVHRSPSPEAGDPAERATPQQQQQQQSQT